MTLPLSSVLSVTELKSAKIQRFPFHLVTNSPWPILVSFSLLALAIGAVMSFHGIVNSNPVLNLGFILTVLGMFYWFNDVIIEGTYKGDHTLEVQKGLEIGFILFVVSEIFAFLSIFWAFFHASLAPAIEIGSQWPPRGIMPLDPFAIPLLNTVLLLSSGAFITFGHHAFMLGNRNLTIIGTAFTLVLAILFTALQYFEYLEAPFTITDSVFGSAFFCSTGLHGLHVLVGTLFILVGFIRIYKHQLTRTHSIGFEMAILYWHFVDVVWIILFSLVYYWTASNILV